MSKNYAAMSVEEILALPASERAAALTALKQENTSLKAAKQAPITCKVSEKGGVSVYGLGRFPVTLYKEQWQKLISMSEEIRTFIETHASQLKTKPTA